jgi:hypothetical protein
MIAADNFNLLNHIERAMNLQQLTEKIRIDRTLDAPNITVKELADSRIEFVVHDYEMRADKSGYVNWIKCLISFKDAKTNRRVVREFHGDYQGIIRFHIALEKEYPDRNFLPLTSVIIENACGFIYIGSTNMQTEIEDDLSYYE